VLSCWVGLKLARLGLLTFLELDLRGCAEIWHLLGRILIWILDLLWLVQIWFGKASEIRGIVGLRNCQSWLRYVEAVLADRLCKCLLFCLLLFLLVCIQVILKLVSTIGALVWFYIISQQGWLPSYLRWPQRSWTKSGKIESSPCWSGISTPKRTLTYLAQVRNSHGLVRHRHVIHHVMKVFLILLPECLGEQIRSLVWRSRTGPLASLVHKSLHRNFWILSANCIISILRRTLAPHPFRRSNCGPLYLV